MSFIRELKRRNVFRVGIAYAVIAWLILQLSDVLISLLNLPDWMGRAVIFVLVVGLPVALILAWAFELTPDGIKRDHDTTPSDSKVLIGGRKLDFVIIGALVIALGYFIWERQQPPVSTTIHDRSVAVLPFVNMSSDQEQEWFADGLTEEILNSLARTPDIMVAARTSSFAYKGTNEDIRSIAEALGVAHILEGSVRRGGDALRITAQLVRAADGFHLWSETYDRPFTDVIEIQEEIALQIANALETAIDPQALAAMVSSGTRSVAAYEAYLTGNGLYERSRSSGNRDVLLDALTEWETAVEIDPEFARAHGKIADFWSRQLLANDIFSDLTDLSREELERRWRNGIVAAIEHEKHPVSKLYYQARKSEMELNFRQASRIYSDYLTQRPHDMDALVHHLVLKRALSQHDQTVTIATDLMKRNERDYGVNSQILQSIRYTGEPEIIKRYSAYAIEKLNGNVSIVYQAHRALLWAGDLRGARELLPLIENSSMPESNRALAALRQACAEQRVLEATRILNEKLLPIADRLLLRWLVYMIMGDKASAHGVVLEFNGQQDLLRLSALLPYGSFDPSLYPNLMARLAGQGIEHREKFDIPYRCDR